MPATQQWCFPLDLSHRSCACSIGEGGCAALAAAVKGSRTLKSLELGDNGCAATREVHAQSSPGRGE
eukprot:5052160-Pleurochrysis_carterae.AAC.2